MPAETNSTRPSGSVSRAPVAVLIVGLGLAVGLVLLGANLAAEPAPPPASAEPGTSASPREVNVIMRDYAFNPDPLFLTPGEIVTFNVVNGGLVEHELVLGDAAVQQAWANAHAVAMTPAPFATPPPASAPAGTGGLRVLLGSGGSTTVSYVVPIAGALQLFCHLPGHAEQGMHAQVVLASR